MQTLDFVLYLGGAVLVAAFVYIFWSYARGLRNSPREMFILFTTKLIEYSAYGAINLTFVLYLSADCGLGDISAGSFIGGWSMLLTLVTAFVGAVCDAIGIKKTLLIGAVALVFARIFLPLTNNPAIAALFGFVPMAFGIAITGPVLSVGIRRYTTKEGAALGFALFYTMMNIGWAIGGYIFDAVRTHLGEHTMVDVVGLQMSTYQVIFLVGFLLTLPNVVLVLLMRDRVRMTEDQGVVIDPAPPKQPGGVIVATWRTFAHAAAETWRIFRQVITERYFWYYLFMLGLLVFVRLVFYHFHYTFPKYGIRVLGEGVKIGNIYSVLNPVMIVFLVPFVGALTRKISSYKMMMIGTTLSAVSVFIATMPSEIFSPLMNTWLGELILVRWLNVPVEQQSPVFIMLVVFVFFFTIGESIWSPRLMQFTAEIAPKGREGSYISLSYLPFFASKLIAGPLSGWLVATYTPEGAGSYPNHQMVWVWIGGMALVSPAGLFIFRKLFHRAERVRDEGAPA
jgi:MFS family permease